MFGVTHAQMGSSLGLAMPRGDISAVSEPVKWVQKSDCLRAINSGVPCPEDASCRASRSPHLGRRWVQWWQGGGKSPFFWVCGQLWRLKSCFLTPSCPGARDLGEKPIPGAAVEEGAGLPAGGREVKG